MIKTETRPCVDCGDDAIAPEPEATNWVGDWLCYWCHCKRENFDVKERLNHFAEMFKLEQLVPCEQLDHLKSRLKNMEQALEILCGPHMGTTQSRNMAQHFAKRDRHIVHEWRLKTDTEYSQERKDALFFTIHKLLDDLQ